MPSSFKCPSCAAPLEFGDSIMQRCSYCSAQVMAPPEVYENESFKQAQKVKKVNVIVDNILSNSDFGTVNIIDASTASKHDINENLAGILSEVRAGNEDNAVQVFKKSFHVSGNDAARVIDSMRKGQGFDLSGFNLDLGDAFEEASRKKRRNNMIGWILVAATLLFAAFGIAAIIILDSYYGS